ncbi:ribonuclease [Chitinibacter fontanus]|uniref:Ribonuclease n=1 Tax=Chitinibacter fontanus TaxID=1737446 RepID=A0A7D5ZJC6_9NEIS|nr:ribonuclease domain-containing protein [Chitinibacter fontanus]QLI82807.1 ribonuclease [Chitinibacter fontanus]
MKIKHLITMLTLLGVPLLAYASANTPSCEQVAMQVAQQQQVSAPELLSILHSLNHYQRLPEKFVTKKQAYAAGWQPGSSLWSVLPGKSIGGDHFGNRERRLPAGQYYEADLDYQGKKRNAKRLVFQPSGKRFITVDHYQNFSEIPACQ